MLASHVRLVQILPDRRGQPSLRPLLHKKLARKRVGISEDSSPRHCTEEGRNHTFLTPLAHEVMSEFRGIYQNSARK